MSKYANDLDMMSQALLAQMQRERDDAIKASMQDMATAESLRQQLAECERERDAIKGALGCEDCCFFLDRGPNALTDPAVSDAAFRAVFFDVPEIQAQPTYQDLQEQLATVKKQRDEMAADLNAARHALFKEGMKLNELATVHIKCRGMLGHPDNAEITGADRRPG